MKTRMVEQREGEDCGPVDWSHPWIAECGIPLDTLRAIESCPGEWTASDDGGWPKFGHHQVLAFRMYDGWPYWERRPAFLVAGPLGPEWRWLDGYRHGEVRHAARLAG
jgi:hypothetical protein